LTFTAAFFVGLVQEQTSQMQANSEAYERTETERKSNANEENNECASNETETESLVEFT
jgi:hypothetical protein